MGQYRKKPVVIEAQYFDGDNALALAAWCGGMYETEAKPSDPTDVARWILIPTLDGTMRAAVGDWIIKGAKGEFYPCKPDIFEQTYEAGETWRCGNCGFRGVRLFEGKLDLDDPYRHWDEDV